MTAKETPKALPIDQARLNPEADLSLSGINGPDIGRSRGPIAVEIMKAAAYERAKETLKLM